MKLFTLSGGAHGYAKNNSIKNKAHRWIVYDGHFWDVVNGEKSPLLEVGEKIVAHYFNGQKMEDKQ